jgi:hypothetical protein
VKVVLEIGGSATPVAGSANPTLVSSFAVFRRARSAVDTLPAAAHLREQLAAAGAKTYDPSQAVLLRRTGAHTAVYAVPATIALPVLPVSCAGLPQLAGLSAYLASQADENGSGAGACMISTQLVPRESSGTYLPGAASPKPTKTLTVAGAVCKSQAVLSGYQGALADERLDSTPELALIPDGVSAITYTLADGRQLTAPVTANLVTPPAALSIPPTTHPVTATELGRLLAAHLPTTVTETGPGEPLVASLARPDALIPDAVGSLTFLRRLITPVLASGSSSSSSSSGTGASCSARTHRCVAVTVTTTCNVHDRCQTTRTIHRYRYVTAKPPPGTTGPDTQPTAPIVGRVNRFITRPGKLTLVLSGAPHRQVTVLLSASCFSRHNAAFTAGGPPLQIAVPSSTPISLPGRARTYRACDVGALVISSQPGSVHATVARG